MKLHSILLCAAFVASIGGVTWLVIDNSRLRRELANVPAPKTPGRAVSAVTTNSAESGAGGSQRDHSGPKTAVKATGRVSGGARDAVATVPFTPGALGIEDNGDGTFTVRDSVGPWQRVMTAQQLRDLSRSIDSAMQASVTKYPGGPSWSPGRAAGAPDTQAHGDYETAWASQSPDAGKEWLQLKYAKAVEVKEINIHETYNPGALSKVSAIMPDGGERVIWEGTEDAQEGVIERAVKVPPGIRSDQIRIELDTSRVPGWNEIDAVELVGADGSRQWAAESTASSYYGQGRSLGLSGSDILVEVQGLGGPEPTTLPLESFSGRRPRSE